MSTPPIRPLPDYLVKRYAGWRATHWVGSEDWFRRLAVEPQKPRAMVISCCDSRVQVTSIFGAEEGELFVHRNVANLVPPYEPGSDHHGTSAAVEYAVTALHVAHLIVMGHSGCGGVKGCYHMCEGDAPELEESTSFVGRWLDILRPAHARLPEGEDATRIDALEKEGVLVSLENLMKFPFVAEAVKKGELTLHGLWNDIGQGRLECCDAESGGFVAI